MVVGSNSPRKGEGWEDFLEEDDKSVWHDAFESDGNSIDIEEYDHFDSIHELVNFVLGSGSYEGERGFAPCREDIEDKKREMHNSRWVIPEKIEDIKTYLAEDGLKRSEINVDPSAEAQWSVSEEEAKMRDHDTKYTAHFSVYDPDRAYSEDSEATLYMSVSWYDDDPSTVDLEEVFDIEEIGENIRDMDEDV